MHSDVVAVKMMMNGCVGVDDTVSNDHHDKNNEEDIFSEIAREYIIIEIY